jgi:serine/threonine protein kinase
MHKQKHKGGAFLGSGAYACVFSPPVSCEDTDTDTDKKNKHVVNDDANRGKRVGKLFKNMTDGNNEANIMKHINKIDRRGVFVNRMLSDCSVTQQQLTKDARHDLHDCIYLKTTDPHATYHQITYDVRAVDLQHFISTEEFYVLDEDLLRQLLRLANGIRTLGANEWCHRDLKPTNIIKTTDAMLMNDFGLACRLNEVYAWASDYVLLHKSHYYPPEFKVFMALKQYMSTQSARNSSAKKIPSQTTIKNHVVDEVFKKFNIIHDYRALDFTLSADYKRLSSLKKDILNMIEIIVRDTYEFIQFNQASKLDAYFHANFAHKLDSFGLGMIMLSLLNNSHNNRLTNTPYLIDQEEQFAMIISNSINMNAFDRSSVFDLYHNLNKFIKSHKSRIVRRHNNKANDAIYSRFYQFYDHFTKSDLKRIAAHYSLSVSGNKRPLFDRVQPILQKLFKKSKKSTLVRFASKHNLDTSGTKVQLFIRVQHHLIQTYEDEDEA